MSVSLTARAWSELLYMDLIGLRGFRAVKRCVTSSQPRIRTSAPPTSTAVTAVVDAMKTACVLYFKQPQCLQRSAVVTRMLRRRGVPAAMVIGCHLPPLKAHAWVEVAGDVVSDYQDGLEYFRVLDRW